MEPQLKFNGGACLVAVYKIEREREWSCVKSFESYDLKAHAWLIVSVGFNLFELATSPFLFDNVCRCSFHFCVEILLCLFHLDHILFIFRLLFVYFGLRWYISFILSAKVLKSCASNLSSFSILCGLRRCQIWYINPRDEKPDTDFNLFDVCSRTLAL